MKGLELSRAFFEECGKPAILEAFPEKYQKMAFGLVGSGSECFGFDDEISQDHDFEPGFAIFLPEGLLDSREEFLLERVYAKLPRDFMGFRRSLVSPVGGNRHGVIKAEDFFISKCGSPNGILTAKQWLTLPEYALAEAVNGEIFEDVSGKFSAVRSRLAFYPEDIYKKKLAGYLLTMAQSGQYNYSRCVSRGETGAAQLAVQEFVNAAMHVVFLFNRKYMPYYKWSFRALKDLPILGNLSDSLEFLITSDNGVKMAESKLEMIEDIAKLVIDRLQEENLTAAICLDLEKHAYSVNDHVTDGDLRNQNVFAGV